VEGPDGTVVTAVGATMQAKAAAAITARSDTVTEAHIYVALPESALTGSQMKLTFIIADETMSTRNSSVFLTGVKP
jgi:hypothetical protein